MCLLQALGMAHPMIRFLEDLALMVVAQLQFFACSFPWILSRSYSLRCRDYEGAMHRPQPALPASLVSMRATPGFTCVHR